MLLTAVQDVIQRLLTEKSKGSCITDSIVFWRLTRLRSFHCDTYYVRRFRVLDDSAGTLTPMKTLDLKINEPRKRSESNFE